MVKRNRGNCGRIEARKKGKIGEKACTMIRYTSEKQGRLEGFVTGLERELDGNNRWVRLAASIPWDGLADGYYRKMSSKAGRPAKDARLVIGAVIIKHKLCLSDEETVRQIQENPYLQYFVGLTEYQKEEPFAPSLFVEIRRRMGEDVFSRFNEVIVEALAKSEGKTSERKTAEKKEDDDPKSGKLIEVTVEAVAKIEAAEKGEAADKREDEDDPKSGRLILDATVAPQAIAYPTDINLLNESREIAEKIIDVLSKETAIKKKPRTYRERARGDYLSIVKRRKPTSQTRRKGVREQLQYVQRNLKHINEMLDKLPDQQIPLSHKMLRKYWIIRQVYEQQKEMYDAKKQKVDNRVVSVSQPHIRPIVRGKAGKSAEFGAKLSVSLTKSGIATVDRIGWDAFNESEDLEMQVERYKEVHGHYPESVIADPIYGTRANRKWLADKRIRYCGKPLGRPRKETPENKEELKKEKKQRQADYRERIPIEGKFGQGKNGYGLGYIRAKTARTSEAWIRSIFLVMNLLVLERAFLLLIKTIAHSRNIVRTAFVNQKNAFFHQKIIPISANKQKSMPQNYIPSAWGNYPLVKSQNF